MGGDGGEGGGECESVAWGGVGGWEGDAGKCGVGGGQIGDWWVMSGLGMLMRERFAREYCIRAGCVVVVCSIGREIGKLGGILLLVCICEPRLFIWGNMRVEPLSCTHWWARAL